jgi:hypothetical protein
LPLDPLQALSGFDGLPHDAEAAGCTQPSRFSVAEANLEQDNHE